MNGEPVTVSGWYLCGWDVIQRYMWLRCVWDVIEICWDILEMIEMWWRMDWDIIYRFWLRCGWVAVEMWKIKGLKLSKLHERSKYRKMFSDKLAHPDIYIPCPSFHTMVLEAYRCVKSLCRTQWLYYRAMQAILSKNAECRQKH